MRPARERFGLDGKARATSIPAASVRSEQRRQTAQSALALRVASLFGLACVAPQLQTAAGMLLRRVLARPKIEATRGTWVFQQTPRPQAQRPRNRAEQDRLLQAARRVSAAALINTARRLHGGGKAEVGSSRRDVRSGSLERMVR